MKIDIKNSNNITKYLFEKITKAAFPKYSISEINEKIQEYLDEEGEIGLPNSNELTLGYLSDFMEYTEIDQELYNTDYDNYMSKISDVRLSCPIKLSQDDPKFKEIFISSINKTDIINYFNKLNFQDLISEVDEIDVIIYSNIMSMCAEIHECVINPTIELFNINKEDIELCINSLKNRLSEVAGYYLNAYENPEELDEDEPYYTDMVQAHKTYTEVINYFNEQNIMFSPQKPDYGFSSYKNDDIDYDPIDHDDPNWYNDWVNDGWN